MISSIEGDKTTAETRRVVRRFKEVLEDHQSSICLELNPCFEDLLNFIPSLDSYATCLRTKFERETVPAILEFLGLINESEDLDLWKEFFIALDIINLKSARTLLINDEDFQGKQTRRTSNVL